MVTFEEMTSCMEEWFQQEYDKYAELKPICKLYVSLRQELDKYFDQYIDAYQEICREDTE